MKLVEKIQQYEKYDMIVEGKMNTMNPYDVNIYGIISDEHGSAIQVPGFYAGDHQYIVRFSPKRLGKYTCHVISDDMDIDIQKEFECIDNDNKRIFGGLKVTSDKRRFCYEDGTMYFPKAYECNWLWALAAIDDDNKKLHALIDQLDEYGFNQVLTNVFAYDTDWKKGHTGENDFGPPPIHIWGGTNEEPDYKTLNIDFFEKYDNMMDYLYEKGIIAHIYFKVYNKGVNWPEKYSLDEQRYIKYVTARYQAYPNIIWDFAKEGYNEEDKNHIEYCIKMIKSNDGYNRLMTLHDDRLFYEDEKKRKLLDFFTVQHHDHFNSHCDYYYFPQYCSARYDMPVFIAEFGYEHGPKGLTDLTYNCGQTVEELVHRAGEILISGSYLAYYYTYTAWDIIDFSHIPKGFKYIANMFKIIESVDWYHLEPMNIAKNMVAMCLRKRGERYFFWFEGGHRQLIDYHNLKIECKNKPMRAKWYRIYELETKDIEKEELERITMDKDGVVENNTRFLNLTPPFGNEPAFLLIEIDE